MLTSVCNLKLKLCQFLEQLKTPHMKRCLLTIAEKYFAEGDWFFFLENSRLLCRAFRLDALVKNGI